MNDHEINQIIVEAKKVLKQDTEIHSHAYGEIISAIIIAQSNSKIVCKLNDILEAIEKINLGE